MPLLSYTVVSQTNQKALGTICTIYYENDGCT